MSKMLRESEATQCKLFFITMGRFFCHPQLGDLLPGPSRWVNPHPAPAAAPGGKSESLPLSSRALLTGHVTSYGQRQLTATLATGPSSVCQAVGSQGRRRSALSESSSSASPSQRIPPQQPQGCEGRRHRERTGMAASNRQQPPGAQAAQQALSAANPTGELCRVGPAHQEFRWALRSTRALRSTLLIFFFFFFTVKGTFN